MAGLNGRLTRLERRFGPATGPDRCRGCGLRHVSVLTIPAIRGAIGLEGYAAPEPRCACACCPIGRGLAELMGR